MSELRIKISIPIRVGGFTGQRDQWEEYEQYYNVIWNEDGNTITLIEDSLSGQGRTITLNVQTLNQALAQAARIDSAAADDVHGPIAPAPGKEPWR